MDRHAVRRASSFRFVQLAPTAAPPLEDIALARLANRLTSQGSLEQDGVVPAGYTYLGQFVAHDLSFDRTQAGLATRLTPAQLVQARSPALDLDCLYGEGPGDSRSEHLYRGRGPFLATGTTREDPDLGIGPYANRDLLRWAALPRLDRARRPGRQAVIADPRNDDNLAVAQTHLALARFHNRVVELETDPDAPRGERLRRARAIVTRHYQWVVWHDLLPRLCDPGELRDVWDHGRRAIDRDAPPGTPGRMPLEFSAAAFRLGHSMVRGDYVWNRFGSLSVADLFRHSGRSGNLGGGTALASRRVADFRRLYRIPGAAPSPTVLARRIDTYISGALATIPPGAFAATGPVTDIERNLAFRNLARARSVGLASGQEMHAFLRGRGVDVEALDPELLVREPNGGMLTGLAHGLGSQGLEHTPLWIYVLREAELHGFRLWGVGARIVAETFHRSLAGSRVSILDPDDWTPWLAGEGEPFGMPELLLYAAGGKPAALGPPDD